MKKIISAIIICVMLAAMLVPAVSADDGVILFQDNFESGFNDRDWKIEGTLFELQPGGPTNSNHLEGWAEAVVQQTSYGDDAPAPRTYGPNFAFKCDAWVYGDGGKDADNHWIALWWADHFTDEIGGERIVYTVRLSYEDRKVSIIVHGEGQGQEFFPEETEVASWNLPAGEKLEMDENKPTVVNIGMRVNGTQIDGFFNNKKVVSFTAPRMGQAKCPLIYWNGGCYTGYDNFVVSTADYNLFNESAEASPAGNNGGADGAAPADPGNAGGNGGAGNGAANNGGGEAAANDGGAANGAAAQDGGAGETVIETRVETRSVVVGTDENGNEITEIVSEIVSEVVNRDPANTNTSTNPSASNGGSQTGDMAVIVIAVMIAALGSAIVVKKVADR